MFGSIQIVKSGDTIKDTYLDSRNRLTVEKGPGVKVGKIEFDACSKKGVHINGRDCYDGTAFVWVERGMLETGPIDEIELDELFPDPWDHTIAVAQQAVRAEKIAVKPTINPAQVYVNLVNQGMVNKSDMEQRLLQSLRVQGASSFGR